MTEVYFGKIQELGASVRVVGILEQIMPWDFNVKKPNFSSAAN